uniref:Uncharacterized protein n=1 Tax=Aegilops tauschii subsp. strangulata TaxID=200361 RepID=A0A453C357_AEGTS
VARTRRASRLVDTVGASWMLIHSRNFDLLNKLQHCLCRTLFLSPLGGVLLIRCRFLAYKHRYGLAEHMHVKNQYLHVDCLNILLLHRSNAP